MQISRITQLENLKKWSEMKSLGHVWLFVTLWTVAHQAPLSMGFSRQEYWSGLPSPSPGYLPDPGMDHESPTLQAGALPCEPPGKSENLRGHLNHARQATGSPDPKATRARAGTRSKGACSSWPCRPGWSSVSTGDTSLFSCSKKYPTLSIHFPSCAYTPRKSISYLEKSAVWHVLQKQDSVGRITWETL